MNPSAPPYHCRGANCSITLDPDKIILNVKLTGSNSYELPINRIRAVIIERKSVVPFATLTMLTAIGAAIAKYNALWFLVNLTPDTAGRIGAVLAAASIILVIPTLWRALFVNIAISWDGQPSTFRIRFVSAHRGRRLARRFRELSSGS
jgi:hypothetical protein